MTPLRVGLVTCLELPEPDADEVPLLEALCAAGVDARLAAWDDPGVEWGGLDLAVVRSTWNYHHDRDAFVAWAEGVAERTVLANPAPVIRWNTHKGYLADLGALGLPVVPTAWIGRRERASLGDVAARHGWSDVVVKPAVSAGSFDTHRLRGAQIREFEPELARMLSARDVMVQPYVRSVEAHGERSLVFIDGELSHSIRKSPRFAGGHEEVSAALPIDDAERRVATAVMRSLTAGPLPGGARLLYGRVDLARNDEGSPMLMELELAEPSLFLARHPAALDRFVRATRARAIEAREGKRREPQGGR